MRKRSEAKREREEEQRVVREWMIDVPNDPVVEQVVLASMFADLEACDRIRPLCPPDAFYGKPHRRIRSAIELARLRGHSLDPAVLARMDPEVDVPLIERIIGARPDLPEDLDLHVGHLRYDAERAKFAQGPAQAMLEALQDPTVPREKLRAITRSVADFFALEVGRGKYLRNTDHVIAEAMQAIEGRKPGVSHPFGIPGLDYREDGECRLRPGAAPGELTVLTGSTGSGKALALDTPIATTRGWTTMGEIKVGDIIFDEGGNQCRVTYRSPVMHDRECYELTFSDGATIVADADHLWWTHTADERLKKLRHTAAWREKRRINRGAKIRRTGVSAKLMEHHAKKSEVDPGGSIRTTQQIASTILAPHGRTNHSITMAGPLTMRQRGLLIDPYVLGLWLGDGASSGAVYYTNDPDLLQGFRAAGYYVDKGESKDPYRYNITGEKGHRLSSHLRELGVMGDKHIPTEYLRASIDQRIDLLRGLMDTDGHIAPTGRIEFCTTSRKLADGFHELIHTLGLKSRRNESNAVLNGRVVGRRWRFTFTSWFNPFALKRKADRWVPSIRSTQEHRYIVSAKKVASVPVRCIQVDSKNHLFLAGEAMIPTHNTTLLAHMILGLARQRKRVLVGAWEVRAPMTIEMLAIFSLGWNRSRFLDGYSGKMNQEKIPIAKDDREIIHERMRAIGKYLVFMDNPVEKDLDDASNVQVVDALEEHVEASGCDVATWDLLDRAVNETDPSAEKVMMRRVLRLGDRRRIHQIVVHQQLLKGADVREDAKPTLKGIMGSSSFSQNSGLVLAPYMPSRHKAISPGNVIEVYGLKQRYGEPFGVEFEWDGACGSLIGGRSFNPMELADETLGAPSKSFPAQKKKRY